jgi:hypothetical protein
MEKFGTLVKWYPQYGVLCFRTLKVILVRLSASTPFICVRGAGFSLLL